MAAALSLDLRERVVAAIEAGASCGQAAKRFGVGKASAIRWHARFRSEGEVAAKPMGGDRHSHRIEAHAALILQTCEARPQLYLCEVREALHEHGAAASLSGLSRFFRRRSITRKKGASRERAGPGGCEAGPRSLVRRAVRPRPGPRGVH